MPDSIEHGKKQRPSKEKLLSVGSSYKYSEKSRFYQNPIITHINSSDEMGLHHQKRGHYYTLDPMGIIIWDALKVPCTLEDVVETVQSVVKVDSSECVEGVRNLCQDLINQGFLIEE